jgi:hypothetical protein
MHVLCSRALQAQLLGPAVPAMPTDLESGPETSRALASSADLDISSRHLVRHAILCHDEARCAGGTLQRIKNRSSGHCIAHHILADTLAFTLHHTCMLLSSTMWFDVMA